MAVDLQHRRLRGAPGHLEDVLAVGLEQVDEEPKPGGDVDLEGNFVKRRDTVLPKGRGHHAGLGVEKCVGNVTGNPTDSQCQNGPTLQRRPNAAT